MTMRAGFLAGFFLCLLLSGTVIAWLVLRPGPRPIAAPLGRSSSVIDAKGRAVAETPGQKALVHPEGTSAVPSLRSPVPPAAEGHAEPPGPQQDPCEDLRAENVRLNEEIASLREHNGRLREYDYATPFGRFLRSPDAEMMSDEDLKVMKEIMVGGHHVEGVWHPELTLYPFYLQPGEARQLLELWQHYELQYNPYPYPYEYFEEAVIRFVGRQRILEEAPPGWLRMMTRVISTPREDEIWLWICGHLPPEDQASSGPLPEGNGEHR